MSESGSRQRLQVDIEEIVGFMAGEPDEFYSCDVFRRLMDTGTCRATDRKYVMPIIQRTLLAMASAGRLEGRASPGSEHGGSTMVRTYYRGVRGTS